MAAGDVPKIYHGGRCSQPVLGHGNVRLSTSPVLPELSSSLQNVVLFAQVSRTGEQVDLVHTLKAATIDVLGLSVFGYNFGAVEVRFLSRFLMSSCPGTSQASFDCGVYYATMFPLWWLSRFACGPLVCNGLLTQLDSTNLNDIVFALFLFSPCPLQGMVKGSAPLSVTAFEFLVEDGVRRFTSANPLAAAYWVSLTHTV